MDRNVLRGFVRCLGILALVIAAGTPAFASEPVSQSSLGAEGEEATLRELFTAVSPDAPAAQAIGGEWDRSVVRSRFVGVNLDHLTEVESIALNLFDGLTIPAIRERVEKRSEGRYTWFGGIPGMEFSSVILTIENGDLVGQIRIDGKVYHVRPLGDGLHVVRQLDPSAFPRGDWCRVRVPDQDVGTRPLRGSQEPQLQHDDGSTIDIMVVYTDDVAFFSSNIGAEIQHAIDVTNNTYYDSLINQRLRLVHTAEVNYAEPLNSSETLDCITFEDGCLDEILDWRDEYHADIVSLWVQWPMDWGTTSGIGWLMNSLSPWFEGWAFNVVCAWAASDDFVLAHEAGHNMGAHHDTYVAGGDATVFPYSHGYNWTGWTTPLTGYCRYTVMAYSAYCYDHLYLLTTERMGLWSNPNITLQLCEWPFGWPCTDRMPIGDAATADNARTLNETAYTVANFRQSNRAPVADAGGPYLAECQGSSTMLTLDGIHSVDPDPGDTLTYSWTTDCPGGSFSDSTTAQPTLTVDTSASCSFSCTVSLRVTDTGGLWSADSAMVTIQDTIPPILDPLPGNVTVECDAVPVAPTVTATDICDSSVTASFNEERIDGSCPSNYTLTRTWTATDDCGNAASHTQTVTVQDTTPPVIMCNAPSIIIPPDAPISFTATATDNCSAPSVEIRSFNCTSKKGRSKLESCVVSIAGNTITIRDSGGVGTTISWMVRATDDCGNSSDQWCSVLVANPGHNR